MLWGKAGWCGRKVGQGLGRVAVGNYRPKTLTRELWGQVLFKVYRHLPRAKRVKPVMVHINYHPGAPAPPHQTLHTTLICGRLACLHQRSLYGGQPGAGVVRDLEMPT